MHIWTQGCDKDMIFKKTNLKKKIILLLNEELDKDQQVRLFFGCIILVPLLLFALIPGVFSPHDPYTTNFDLQLQPPRFNHLFGTDFLGRDIFSRTIHGTRASFSAAFLSVCIGLVMALPLGLTAGYIGGLIDKSLTLFFDSIYVFPTILTALIITYLLLQLLHRILLFQHL